ncbi:hypothetical protein PMIN01_06417 [Paraphaeosphaeria minitans]|uniref:Uncharacterized protein n=1 Tax=Paraphaeosphaeria minitans TaxID=565426 RepID=A0A9P6GG48_9PLEO|nr:hypothetical protein PMIN01_06417 [Paraphaeosphaeria minitans]
MSSRRLSGAASPETLSPIGEYPLPASDAYSSTSDAYSPTSNSSSHTSDSSSHTSDTVYPRVPYEDSYHTQRVLKKNAMRLFARDFAFRPAEVSHWLFPDGNRPIDLGKKLDEWQGKWAKAMFGSAELIRRARHLGCCSQLESQMNSNSYKQVFDFAKEHEQKDIDSPKLKEMEKIDRINIWVTAFTDDIFQIIVDPLRQSVKIIEFFTIEAWRDMYCEAFITAADAMYMMPPLRVRKRGIQPKINYAAVYDAVRKVPGKFPVRPQLEYIPAHPLRASAAEMASFERRK